ncbi:MAG: hydrogenase formation protein HypD [Actinobacteria bacterium]|nr:hydrogenase formation protein HypD [Actinomycetota bacterium]
MESTRTNKSINKRIDNLIQSISQINMGRQLNIMEVCGTHTMAISRNGLRELLPPYINLISGPGCPVCVTSINDIDYLLEIIRNYDVSIFTFGDMMKVPGTSSSLYKEKSNGKDINICYSPIDAIEFARNNPQKKVIFVAIGFETTIPLTSVIVKRAYKQSINNFYIYNAHKLIPPALQALLEDREIRIDGFLCPGHVSTIIGSKPYKFIPDKYRIPCAISGFEPLDILSSIEMIVRQLKEGNPKVEVQYTRVVREEGNPTAIKEIEDVFEVTDSVWRGIGNIPNSGLKLRPQYSRFDAKKVFKVKNVNSKEHKTCECGNILKGLKKPTQCKLFSKVCTPESPVGPCMVSSEGTCAAYYKYERFKIR